MRRAASTQASLCVAVKKMVSRGFCSSALVTPVAHSSSSWGQWSAKPAVPQPTSHHLHHEAAADEPQVEILHVDEIIMPGDSPVGDNSSPTTTTTATTATAWSSSADAAGPPGSSQKHTPLLKLDPFARSKVLNFIKKQQQQHGTTGAPSSSPFVVEKIQFGNSAVAPATAAAGKSKEHAGSEGGEEGGDDEVEYRVTLTLPLPAAYGERVAEGLSPILKDAEAAACMHAERIVDTLGFQLYSLQGSQRRHAEAARAAGRWAPMPEDQPREPSTPSPPPFSFGQQRASGGLKAKQRQQQQQLLRIGSFDAEFDMVAMPSSSSLTNSSSAAPQPQMLAAVGPAPFTVDESAVYRVRSFVRAYGQNNILQCSRVLSRPLPGLDSDLRVHGVESRGAVADHGQSRPGDKDKEFLCQIRLPLHERFGARVASGKASGSKRLAYVLACMHAELIIDTLGLLLFPYDHQMQAKHHADATAAGRWCPSLADSTLYVDRPSPRPLALVSSPKGGPLTVDPQVAAEERLVDDAVHGGQLGASLLHISFVDSGAEEDLANYLRRLGRAARMYSVARLGPKQAAQHHNQSSSANRGAVGYTFRAVCVVPIPADRAAAAANVRGVTRLAQASSPDVTATAAATVFLAMGVARSSHDAVAVCAMHALQCLGALGIAPYGDDSERQQACYDRIVAAGGIAVRPSSSSGSPLLPSLPANLPLAMKLMDPLGAGRIWAHIDAASSALDREQPVPSFRAMQETVASGRRDAQDWTRWDLEHDDERSLIPEASQRRMLVAPEAGSGRNYLHTLYSPRLPCVRAWDRLQDYLERNGQEPDKAVMLRQERTPDSRGSSTAPPRTLHVATVRLPRRARSLTDTAASSDGGSSEQLVAVGESFLSAEDAKSLCAAHAEVLLDAHGELLYDHATLQRRHAETAWALGRHCAVSWGNHSDARDAAAVPLCPPIRREFAGSGRWASSRQQSRPTSSNSNHASLPRIAADDDPYDDQQHSSSASLTSGLSPPMTSSDAVNYHAMRAVLPREANNPKVHERISQFLERHGGGSLSTKLRKFIEKTSDYGIVHHAQLDVPVPSQFGKRVAHGCSSSPGLALVLCLIHAQSIIDALQVQLFDRASAQLKHRDFAVTNRLPITPPLPSDPLAPPGTPSPPPLKCIENDLSAPPVPARPAYIRVGDDEIAWARYWKLVTEFMEKQTAHNLRMALTRGTLPKLGSEVEESAFDAASKIGGARGAEEHVRDVCSQRGFDLPDRFWWEAVKLPSSCRELLFGRDSSPHHESGGSEGSEAAHAHIDHQVLVFYSKQQVWGTPFFAHGWGRSHQEATNRAALHYSAIVLQLCPNPLPSANPQRPGSACAGEAPSSGPGSNVAAAAMSGLTSGNRKQALVQLYCVSHPPYSAASVSLRPSILPGDAPQAQGAGGGVQQYVAVLTTVDEAGLRASEKGRSLLSSEEATVKAYAALHDKLLLQKRSFAAFTHGLRPFLNIQGWSWTALAPKASPMWWVDARQLVTKLHAASQQQQPSTSPSCSASSSLSGPFFAAVEAAAHALTKGKSEETLSPLAVLVAVAAARSSSPESMQQWPGSVVMRSPHLSTLTRCGFVSCPGGSSPQCTPLGQWVACAASELLHAASASQNEPQDRAGGGKKQRPFGALLHATDDAALLAVASIIIHGALLGEFDAALTIAAAFVVTATPQEEGDARRPAGQTFSVDVLHEAGVFSRAAAEQRQVGHADGSSLASISTAKTGLLSALALTTSTVSHGGAAPTFGSAFTQRFGSVVATALWPQYTVQLRAAGASVPSSLSSSPPLQRATLFPTDQQLFYAEFVRSLLGAVGFSPNGALLMGPRCATAAGAPALDNKSCHVAWSTLPSRRGMRAQIDPTVIESWAEARKSRSPAASDPAVASGLIHLLLYDVKTQHDENHRYPPRQALSPVWPQARLLATTAALVKVVGVDDELDMMAEDDVLYFTPHRGVAANGGSSPMTTLRALHGILRKKLEQCEPVPPELLKMLASV